MSDFHRSLDRAIGSRCDYWAIDETTAYDPHTDWGLSGDALTDLMAARDLMADRPARYDIRYRDPEIVRPLSDMESLMAELENPVHEALRRYQRYYSNAAVTFLAGVDWDSFVVGTPLCDQDIPAEGVE